MPTPTSPNTRRRRPSGTAKGRAAVLLLMVLIASSLAGVVGQSASGQGATDKIQSKLDELDRVQSAQGPLESQIDAMNAEVDQLIGRESALRQQEAAVKADLAAKQAELDQATAELNEQKQHLAAIRAHLQRALAALEDLLVDIYKSDQPDIVSVILQSSDWSDLVTRTEYLNRIQDYDEAVVTRVSGLRDEIAAIVEQLTATRERIVAARDVVAAKEKELATARAQISQQHAELVAARASRQDVLDALLAKEKSLIGDLNDIPAPAGRATLVNGEAIPPANAPLAVRGAIEAANQINDTPYVWGGGHGSFTSSGYDCSGAVSYALHGGGFLSSPLDSSGLQVWGSPGGGSWITVFANSGHAWAMIAGLRWDTGGTGGGNGPRWSTVMRSDASSFIPRHPSGY
jgi:peptidoglycan hydrolase CwlO-like protein